MPGEVVRIALDDIRMEALPEQVFHCRGRFTNGNGRHAFEGRVDDIKDAYDLFSRQGDGVMKVALFPNGIPAARRAGRAEALVGTGH